MKTTIFALTCLSVCFLAGARNLSPNHDAYKRLEDMGFERGSFDFNFGMKRPTFQKKGNLQPEDVQTFKIPQKLDNFNPSDPRTFMWRYHVNNNYFKPGGPVIIVVGGEWNILAETITKGTFPAELAERFGAVLFYTEHRFYGESLPFPLLTTDNLRYLSVDQGIEDLAAFIKYFKSARQELKDAKVILTGGSYTGGFVSWFRQVYPELTVGAWSSSGVIDPQTNYTGFREFAGQKYKVAGGDVCYNAFQTAFTQLEQWADAGRVDLIEENFNLCKPLVLQNATSIQALMNAVSLPFVDTTQISRLEQTAQICDYILDTSLHKSVIQGVARVAEFLYGGCIYAEFRDVIRKVARLDWPDPTVHNSRPFISQMCNEFDWFWTGSSKDPFGGKVTTEFWASLCTAAFGKTYTPQTLEENSRRTRLKHGGLANANFTYVYSSQGEFDPWRTVGLNQDLNPTSPTYVIPDAPHCSDISTEDRDLPGVVESQRRVVAEMEKWLQ